MMSRIEVFSSPGTGFSVQGCGDMEYVYNVIVSFSSFFLISFSLPKQTKTVLDIVWGAQLLAF